jgi:hypothetical protein
MQKVCTSYTVYRKNIHIRLDSCGTKQVHNIYIVLSNNIHIIYRLYAQKVYLGIFLTSESVTVGDFGSNRVSVCWVLRGIVLYIQ